MSFYRTLNLVFLNRACGDSIGTIREYLIESVIFSRRMITDSQIEVCVNNKTSFSVFPRENFSENYPPLFENSFVVVFVYFRSSSAGLSIFRHFQWSSFHDERARAPLSVETKTHHVFNYCSRPFDHPLQCCSIRFLFHTTSL